MCGRSTQSGGLRPSRPGGKGFTLIELLTVVAIIGLLIGMIVPTISSVLKAMEAAATLARINSLSAGCRAYKLEETGNRFFPAQEYTNLVAGGGSFAGAASAYLARCLFSEYDASSRTTRFPVDRWAPLEKDMLDPPATSGGTTGTDTPRAYSILDTHSHTMAIVYYVSRKGMEGTVEQFNPSDNSRYTSGNVATGGGDGQQTGKQDIRQYVDGGSGTVHMDGEFVLHAADPETRLYFQGNLKNWSN